MPEVNFIYNNVQEAQDNPQYILAFCIQSFEQSYSIPFINNRIFFQWESSGEVSYDIIYRGLIIFEIELAFLGGCAQAC